MDALITAERLVRRYRGHGGRHVTALDGVSLTVAPGESVAVVGESGSGKSTLVRCLAALERPDAGRVLWDGTDVWTLHADALRQRRRQVQLIFQDARASFNPRFTVAKIVAEPLANFERMRRATLQEQVAALLRRVELDPAVAVRYPHELSGGQLQRVAIARALALRPRLLLCDEPLSSLDVSIQAQMLSLLRDLRANQNLSLLFVTHNLALVPAICDRVLVMWAGQIVEELKAERLMQAQHPYTRALLAAVPDIEDEPATLTRES
jgi:ABC-type dipeptide/oligopeptide/nickel transport system ATPase subunit